MVPIKLFPLIVTILPSVPLVGVKEVITGGAVKINPDMRAESLALFTTISPVDPVSTTAVIAVELTIVKEEAGALTKFTELIPKKLIPCIAIVVP